MDTEKNKKIESCTWMLPQSCKYHFFQTIVTQIHLVKQHRLCRVIRLMFSQDINATVLII